MAVIALLAAIAMPHFAKKEFRDKREYERYEKMLNEDIANGIYHARLNDEWFVFEIEKNELPFIDSVYSEKENYGFFDEICYAVLINAYEKRIVKSWIRKSIIRPMRSVWGLTQSQEALERRVKELENEKSSPDYTYIDLTTVE